MLNKIKLGMVFSLLLFSLLLTGCNDERVIEGTSSYSLGLGDEVILPDGTYTVEFEGVSLMKDTIQLKVRRIKSE